MNLSTSNTGIEVQEQLNEYVEAISDPYKFFSYVKILDSTSNTVIPYEMWEHLRYFIWAVYSHSLVIVLKPKQVGISWTLAAIAQHWCYKLGANVLLLSHGKDEAADLLAKSRTIYQYLPKFLQQETEHDGIFLLSFKDKHSRILSLPSTEDAGIGQTASLVICDENEFHEYARENYAAIKPTIDAGGHLVVVSTVDKTNVDSHFKTLWRLARSGDSSFFPIFFPYDVRPGRDEEWYERTKRDYPLVWQFEENYPKTEEEALSPLTGRSVFDRQVLSDMLLKVSEPLEVRQGAINIYQRSKVGTHYIAGVDIAEGRGGDYSVLYIEGQEGLQRGLVAVIYSNQISVDLFAYMSYELLTEYFNPTVIGGADAFGNTFLNYLVNLGYSKDRIYSSDKKKEKLGYQETEYTQQKDVLELERTIRAGLKVPFKPAVLEMFAYQWADEKGKSKAEPAKGAHNDIIMAMVKSNFGFNYVSPMIGSLPIIRLAGKPTKKTFSMT